MWHLFKLGDRRYEEYGKVTTQMQVYFILEFPLPVWRFVSESPVRCKMQCNTLTDYLTFMLMRWSACFQKRIGLTSMVNVLYLKQIKFLVSNIKWYGASASDPFGKEQLCTTMTLSIHPHNNLRRSILHHKSSWALFTVKSKECGSQYILIVRISKLELQKIL